MANHLRRHLPQTYEYNFYYYCIKGALCAQVIRLRVFYNQNDETLSRNSLIYMSKASLTIAVNW